MARRPRMGRNERLAAEALARALSTREGRKFLLVVLIVGMLAFGAWWVWNRMRQERPAPAAQATGREVRVATWNLRTFSEKANPDLVTIARVIKESRFDVVAIQEVKRTGGAVERLRRQLGEPWRHIVSAPAGDGERFAFLYREDVVVPTSPEGLLQGAEAAVFARRPAVQGFRAGAFDFILITVHLSWGDTNRRRRETEVLSRTVRDLADRGPERDIIVLGDFNEQKRLPNQGVFESAGWVRLNTEVTNLGSTEVYDNLLVNRAYTAEWVGQCGVVRFDETHLGNDDQRARDDVSDHRPVWAAFSTAGPDDD